MKERIKRIIKFLRFAVVSTGIDWNDSKFLKDVNRWQIITHVGGNTKEAVAELLWRLPEFRNLVLYRNKGGVWPYWFSLWYKPMETLYIHTDQIGGGLFIQHGFSTMIAAKSIGENCWINQQVTIGYTDAGQPPVIGDNVTITCGAKVLGNITIGNDVIIAANAVVVKDVESGKTVGGVPAHSLHS